MQWMLDLQTYGLKIHYNTTAEGSIDWVGEQIRWKGLVQFTMKQLCEMIGELIQESREVLFYDLMLIKSEAEIPVIPWSSLRDNPRNEEVGWNYLQDEHNIWPVKGDTWLQTQIEEDQTLQDQFIQEGTVSDWDSEKIQKYLDSIV